MTNKICTYGTSRDEMLVAYLYDEMAGEPRAAFDRHLQGCAACRDELASLGAVRTELGRWAPPAPAGRLTYQPESLPRRASVWRAMYDLPAWAQVAAALLFVGVAAGVANLDVSYSSGGLSVQTGWLPVRREAPSAPAPIPTSAPASTMAAVAGAPETATAGPFVERRTDGGTPAGAALPGAAVSEAEMLRRVRALIQESERRQQSELALRVGEVVREAQALRQADLVKIDRNLGIIQNSAVVEAMRQREMVNSLAVRVSQRQ